MIGPKAIRNLLSLPGKTEVTGLPFGSQSHISTRGPPSSTHAYEPVFDMFRVCRPILN